MVRFDHTYNEGKREHTVVIHYTSHDEMLADLLPVDRAILRSCEASDAVSDKVLALELLVRRMEEGRARRAAVKVEGSAHG